MKGMVASMVIAAVSLLAGRAAEAETELRKIAWSEKTVPEGFRLESDGAVSTSAGDEGTTRAVAEIESPGITEGLYVLRGRVRYDGVAGDGYLEMWSTFDEGSYFTRTLADFGPLQKISGSSGWREFGLYFDARGASAGPRRLNVNLVLPGRGSVSISTLTLSELEEGEWPSFGAGAGNATGFWGGLAGATLGIVGGLLAWLGGRGRAKAFVLAGLRAMIGLGVVGLAVGLVSLGRGLPYEVNLSFLLLSAIAVIAPASALPKIKRRYEELELRRMRALDVG